MKRYILLLNILIGLNSICYSQALIKAFVNSKYSQIQYFKPFKYFGNSEIYSLIDLKKNNNYFETNIEINQPSIAKFIVGYNAIWLLIEPNDSISFKINELIDPIKPAEWLEVSGPNAAGHEYYNLIYNKTPLKKFEGVRSIFNLHHKDDVKSLINYIERELIAQTNWVDSLYQHRSVTYSYNQYIKAEIKSTLAWEIGNLCNSHYGKNLENNLNHKGDSIKAKLFEIVNPLDTKLYYCMLGHAYYDTYFKELYKTKKERIDTSDVLFDDLAYIELAPPRIREYNLGKFFFDNMKYAPEKHDLCEKLKKYKIRYPKSNEYISFLDSINICSKKNLSIAYKIITDNSIDFFNLLQTKFPGKKLYIDLWATWCAPCKAEFMHYDEKFYKLLDNNKITALFISIDENNNRGAWEKAVVKLNLKGYHLIAGDLLKKSIKDVIYNNNLLSIPRYIIVNEKNKIVNGDARRPSDPLLQNEIINIFSEHKPRKDNNKN